MAIDLTDYNLLIDGLFSKAKSIVLEEYSAGRIKDTEYGKIVSEYIGSIMTNAGAMLDSYYKAELSRQTVSLQIELLQAQKELIQQQKLTEVQTTQVGLQEALLKAANISMVTEQKNMIVAQTNEIPANASKQRDVQDAQIAQINAEASYTFEKENVTRESRLDNLLIETLKAQQTQLATVGAGGLVPSTNDFAAANNLRQQTYNRARNIDLSSVTFLAGTNYTKAT